MTRPHPDTPAGRLDFTLLRASQAIGEFAHGAPLTSLPPLGQASMSPW